MYRNLGLKCWNSNKNMIFFQLISSLTASETTNATEPRTNPLCLWECVPLTISYHFYFFCISKVWSMLHQGSVGWVQSRECYFMFTYTFWHFFVIFHHKNMRFYHFHFFQVSHFHNKILTNQKPELFIRNRQRNCMWKLKSVKVGLPGFQKCLPN